jgi:hypothetical protein
MTIRKFLSGWYRKDIRPCEVVEAFQAWINTDWGDKTPGLVFTLPDEEFTIFFPPRRVEVVGVNARIRLRFEIENGFTPPWYEQCRIEELPAVVQNFLRVDTDEKVRVTLGPNI